MTFLDLSHNYFYGMKPTVFGDNSYATELRLDYNYLTTMAGVPLDKQTGLKMLNVSHNQVSGGVLLGVQVRSMKMVFNISALDIW